MDVRLKLGCAAGLILAVLPASAQEAPKSADIRRGAYLARAADCAACHTAPGGKPFAGGLGIATPLGTVVTTNITPSKRHGIGGYSLEQFARALRRGIRADGAHLYPAMPYTSYAAINDADVAALYGFFMTSVTPVDRGPTPTKLPFPFNIRLSMAAWNLLFLDKKPFRPDPSRDAEWNRGAYLADALAHCSVCHTPRNLLMAEDKGRALGGASLGTWYAPNISATAAGVGEWTQQQLVDYLAKGDSFHGSQAGGPMREAIDKSFSGLTGADLQAIARYIRTPADGKALPPAATAAAPPAGAASDLALRAMPAASPANMNGAQLYDAYCASCHQADGRGTAGDGLPALAGNSKFHQPNADNVVMAILTGIWPIPPRAQAMPAFATLLSDEQIVRLTNSMFAEFGDKRITVSARRVAELRNGGAKSSLVLIVRLAMAAGAIGALAGVTLGIAWWRRKRRRGA